MLRVVPTFLDGAILALGALPDVLAVVDGHRCELERAYKQDRVHDLYSTLLGDGPHARNQRIFAIRWDRAHDAMGTEDDLRVLITRIAELYPGKPILILRNVVSMLIHTDLEGLASSLKVPNPLVVVDQDSTDDDWIDGWAAVERAVLTLMVDSDSEKRPVITGFCLHRLEGDESGNLTEIKRLLSLVGFQDACWPMDGEGVIHRTIHRESLFYHFPYTLAPNEGSIRLDLPIGFEATSKMLRQLASEDIEDLIEKERERLRARLLPIVTRRLAGRASVVIAEPCRAFALYRALRELGMDVPWVILLRRRDALCPEKGLLEAAGVDVWMDPDFAEVRDRMCSNRDYFDVVVGSGAFDDAACSAALPFVELGYPYYYQHFTACTPFMGFDGILRLADRVANAIAESG